MNDALATSSPHDQDRLALDPRVPPGEAIRRRPMLLIVPAVVLAVLGAVVGVLASNTYTAIAQLVVQPLAPTISQLPAAVQSAEDQATNESRLIHSSGVIAPLAQEFNTTPTSIANHISATPIPESTVIRLEAEASSAHAAIALANAAAATFSHYLNAELQSTTESGAVFRRYEAAAAVLDQTRNAKLALEAKHVGLNGLVRVSAAIAAAQLRANALSARYQSTIQALATAPAVKSFDSATTASSNRASLIETYALGGLIVGLLIGAAMALALANRPNRRVVSAASTG
jgi:capsular polysaccharide biosynthesis protein